MMTDDDDVRAKKIRKLLAKAEHGATPEEAEAFAAKAQALMTKWAIDDLPRDDEPATERIVFGKIALHVPYWESDLALVDAIASANDVLSVFFAPRPARGGGEFPGSFVLIGYESDVENTRLLYSLLLTQIHWLSMDIETSPDPGVSLTVYIRSFRAGFAQTIGRRLAERRASVVEQAARTDVTLLPALNTKADRVRQAKERVYPDIPDGDIWSGKEWSHLAAGEGARAGHRADIGDPAVGEGATPIASPY